MNPFEKILELIKQNTIQNKDSISFFNECDVKFISAGKAKEIVQEVAEEYKGGWIPCKEGLPAENIEVDVTIKEIDGSTYTQTSWLQEGQWVVKKSPLKPKVIAWKERPEPYKPNGERIV